MSDIEENDKNFVYPWNWWILELLCYLLKQRSILASDFYQKIWSLDQTLRLNFAGTCTQTSKQIHSNIMGKALLLLFPTTLRHTHALTHDLQWQYSENTEVKLVEPISQLGQLPGLLTFLLWVLTSSQPNTWRCNISPTLSACGWRSVTQPDCKIFESRTSYLWLVFSFVPSTKLNRRLIGTKMRT